MRDTRDEQISGFALIELLVMDSIIAVDEYFGLPALLPRGN